LSYLMMDMADAARFGGRRALVRHLFSRLLAAVGAYRRYLDLDWSRIRRVVFVCRGNICRSPYAELSLRARGIRAASAGLDATPGSRSPESAVRNAAALGVSLGEHTARAWETMAIEGGDLIAVFEPEHAAEVSPRIQGRDGVQVTLVGIWARPPYPYIHDPYALPDAYFRACYSRIDSALEEIRDRIEAARGRDAFEH
jgi:protein-tyrosine-phosphatase